MPQEPRRRGPAALAASFDGIDEARAALEVLRHAGFDGVDVSLAGIPIQTGPADPGPGPAGRRSLMLAARRCGLGALVGGLVGAVIGVVGAVLMMTATSTEAAVWVLALVGTGLMLGIVTGACVGVERGIALGDDWELALHHAAPGRVWVLVRAGNGVKVARAAEILGELAPGRVRWAPTGGAVRRSA